jgi:predicted phosphodiesterase
MEKVSRVAAVYDVHGNLPALEAVSSDLEGINLDLLIAGGDVASGPMPAEVLDCLEAMGDCVRWVRGNADREVVSAFDEGSSAADTRSSEPVWRASSWAASRIGSHHPDLMASFEEHVVVEVEGLGAVLFCHATPNSDEEIVTTATPDTRLRGILALGSRRASSTGTSTRSTTAAWTTGALSMRGAWGSPSRASPWTRPGRCSAPREWTSVAANTTSGARSRGSEPWTIRESRTWKRPS